MKILGKYSTNEQLFAKVSHYFSTNIKKCLKKENLLASDTDPNELLAHINYILTQVCRCYVSFIYKSLYSYGNQYC